MKKCFLVIILVLLGAFFTTGALAQSQDATLVMSDLSAYETANAVCWVDNTLYILGNEGVYRWQHGLSQPETVLDLSETRSYRYQEQAPEDEAGKAAWEKAVQYLFTDGEQLYALQPYSGQIYLVKESMLQLLTGLPKEQLFASGDGQSMFRGIQDIAWADKALYLLLGTDDPTQRDKTELFRFDMANGEMTPCSTIGIQNVYAGPGGKLMLAIRPGRTPDGIDPNAGIWQYDIASDTLEKQLMANDSEQIACSVLYREQDQSVYYIKSGEVISRDNAGKTYVRAYVPISMYGSATKASISFSGLYAYTSGKYIFIRETTQGEAAEKTVLRILGDINPELVIQFSIENPDIALIPMLGDIRQSVLTVDPEIDMYIVNAPGPYAAMKSKGYTAEMNQDANLVDMARKLYPAIQDAIFSGDKLLAYPLTLLPESWTVNETMWKEFGFDAYPRTYKELFAYMALWNEEYARTYPDYTFFDMQQDIAGYVTMIIKEYILQYEEADAPLSFDREEFRAAISDVIAYRNALDSILDTYGMPIVFSYYQGFGVGSNDGEKTVMVLPPALDDSEAQAINAKLELIVVNQASLKQEQALRFVSFCAENSDITTQYMIDPSLNEPIRPDNYSTRLQTLQDELKALQASAINANADQNKAISDAIASKEVAIKNVVETHWLISQEGVENYRSVAKYMRIPYASGFLTEDESSGLAALQPIIERYCTQGLSADTIDRFIGELDRVSLMIYAEGT